MTKHPPLTVLRQFRRISKRLTTGLVIWLSIGLASTSVYAQGPLGGTVRAGDARISGEGTAVTRIDQVSDRAIIDWRSFTIGAADQVIFAQPSAQAATLNRVTGDQVSVILGTLDATGRIFLINPNGIVFGKDTQVNVGSLIATTSNISDANFMSGNFAFDRPGRPGAGIVNRGALTARDGGLVALVAPHVRNDGVIVARLGTVMLGAADTFTVDLYGDALINLALSDRHAGQLVGSDGQPVTSLVTNAGRIETAGGQTVLMTARNAKNVLDNLINMTGTIKADTAVQQGGRILLLGEGGTVDVGGSLSAQGVEGGSIQVLGDHVHLGASAALDASGATAGGSVQVGGAFQGKGDTYRSTSTTVDAGATLAANARDHGNGGEVVVWSDGHTQFAGTVAAKGGGAGGDGGRMEVSGKQTLNFLGQADASAAAGKAGSLLLDPATLTIGAAEASTITRVLRTGTSTNVQADVDINVDAAIFGGDRESGGGLTMTAGNDINVRDFIVTNAGAINLNATRGTVNIAPGKAVFAGTAPITINAAGNVRTGPLVTSGSLSIRSIAGSVAIDSFIDEHTGSVDIRAAGAVDVNQPIVNMASGGALTIDAGTDITVNAQVDGRGGVAGGAVTMNAARDLNVNQAIVTNNGALALNAASGAITVASGTPLVTGTGALALAAAGTISSGPVSAGSLTINSSAGAVAVNGIIDSTTGDTRIAAASDVTIAQAILNGQSGSALTVAAGRDVNVQAVIDGRGGAAGGSVALTAGRNLNVNDHLLTNNGSIALTANAGALTVAPDKATVSGSAGLTMRSTGDLTTGAVSSGSLQATSTAGSLRVNGVIDGATGRVDLSAANDVTVNAPVLNGRSGESLRATAGHDVVINAPIDGRSGARGGAVTLNAAHDVLLNQSVATNSGAIAITAADGAATMAPGTVLVSGGAAVSLSARGDVTTRGISAGSLSATSTGGSVAIEGAIDGGTGRVDLTAAGNVTINAPVLNTRTGASLTAVAGRNLTVNAPIDGTTTAATGGAVNLTAGGDLFVNAAVATHDGAIRVSATRGAATIAPGAGLFAGTGAIALDAFGAVTTGTLSGGAMNVTSRGGSVLVSGPIGGTGGAIAIGAAGQVDIARAITNPGAASALSINAGTDINVNAAVGRTGPGTPSGSVSLAAGRNVNLNESIVTENGAIAVVARDGTVTTAASKGLFAGSGAVTVESGQTLSTGTISTTGALTLRSTGGSVNVDAAIGGATGPVTIHAANDVNVNQGIANPRSDAPLSVTAGHDINVNARIDGRDNVLTGPSGAATLTAGNNVTLNDNVVSQNAAISVTAQNGTVTTAAGKGLFAGSGPIAVTAGATFDTGLTSTTGALSLTSTNGAVNVNTPIDDTTGDVRIAAGTAVNVNQAITNLKSGSNLAITAGTDINVLAAVDGRTGAAAGGTVAMTAGNNINVTNPIATNDGAVTLTATNGTVTLPIGTEVVAPVFDVTANGTYNQITTPMQAVILAGSAPVSITTGGNFSLTSPVKTTGTLAITSTGGNVTTAAPIDDHTGAVTLTAGNALVINREVRSNDQAITLNAGAGGLTINQIDDHDYTSTSSVNARNANLTINSVGDVRILDDNGVASTQTVTIDTRSQIVQGRVGDAVQFGGRPQSIVLNADGGIVTFSTGYAGSVTATSSGGSINVTVNAPDHLHVTTGTPGTLDCPTCDIAVTSSSHDAAIGADVVLNAGGSVNMVGFLATDALFTARSGDINLTNKAIIEHAFTGVAGRDININSLLWIGADPQNVGGGPLALTAGRDITAAPVAEIHISNGQAATFTANRNLNFYTVETLGPLAFTATTGDITLHTDIGGHILPVMGMPVFNPSDLGVASLTMSAPAATAAITMEGARAEGNVTITTGGTLTAAKQITSVNGTVSIVAAGGATLSAVPIGSVSQVAYPAPVAPAVPPGPKAPLPSAPGLAGNGAPGLPAFAEIAVAAGDQIVAGVIQPGAANGGVGVAGTAGGTNTPGATRGTTGRPAAPSGSSPAQANGASDPSALDSANALRAVGESCGEDSAASADSGLEAVLPKEQQTKKAATGEQKNASCSAAPASSGTKQE